VPVTVGRPAGEHLERAAAGTALGQVRLGHAVTGDEPFGPAVFAHEPAIHYSEDGEDRPWVTQYSAAHLSRAAPNPPRAPYTQIAEPASYVAPSSPSKRHSYEVERSVMRSTP